MTRAEDDCYTSLYYTAVLALETLMQYRKVVQLSYALRAKCDFDLTNGTGRDHESSRTLKYLLLRPRYRQSPSKIYVTNNFTRFGQKVMYPQGRNRVFPCIFAKKGNLCLAGLFASVQRRDQTSDTESTCGISLERHTLRYFMHRAQI